MFRLYFPVAVGAEEPREVHLEEPPQKGTGTILLADDYKGIREAAREMLVALGYEVISAQDGAEAVELFRKNADKIDLVLLDVVLPSRSGPEAYAQISAMRPGTKVIFASGYTAENSLLTSAIQEGITVLQKPYSMSILSRAIRDALAREPQGK